MKNVKDDLKFVNVEEELLSRELRVVFIPLLVSEQHNLGKNIQDILNGKTL